MVRFKQNATTLVRDFFSNELSRAVERQKVTVNKEPFQYLVELLVEHVRSDRFFGIGPDGNQEENVLAKLYFTFLTGDETTRTQSLKRLGDISLMITGIFPDSLNRKLVDIDYYFGMGGKAYWQLGSMQWSQMAKTLYRELSINFKLFSNLLGDLSDRSGLQNNTDILRLYEKWLLTGSERIKKILSDQGIQPIELEAHSKH